MDIPVGDIAAATGQEPPTQTRHHFSGRRKTKNPDELAHQDVMGALPG